ncbi:hypothetical protein A2U01_0078155, partial [Trifolium medium]|nr:hypothetical protein [Trifolium medium]
APSDSHTPHPTSELPIALRKGNRSSQNLNPIYACHLDYILLLWYPWILCLFPKTTGEARSDPDMLW